MLLKWTLVAFALASVALFVLSKLLAWMDPPRPGRRLGPTTPLLRRVERALRWTLLVPIGIAVALLALALAGWP
jgi:hypothetical protein